MKSLLKKLVPAPLWNAVRGCWMARVRRLYSRPQPLPAPLDGLVLCIGRAEHEQFLAPGRTFEPEVCAAIRGLVRAGDACADVGANVGYISLLLVRCAGPDGRVTAFEALPANAALIRRTAAANGLERRLAVEAVAICRGDAAEVDLNEGDSTLEHSLLPRAGHRRARRVPAAALDRYYPAGTRLDFVKMDIEGAEAEALAGMAGILANQRPVLLLEIHGRQGAGAVPLLRANRYQLADLAGRPWDGALGDAPVHVVARPEAR